MPVNWHVLGAGALGSLWAVNLSRSGHHVHLLLKDEDTLEQFRKTGSVTLVSGQDEENFTMEARMAGGSGSEIDYLLITTKAHQTMEALDTVIPVLTENCQIFLLQNGMGVMERIAEELPGRKIFCGVTTDGAYCPGLFSVVHAGVGQTYIGSYSNVHDPVPLIDKLPSRYLNIGSCDDIVDRQWQKLAINCAVNGLTVIFQCRNGELLNIPEATGRLKKLCDEISRLGEVLGYTEWKDNLYNSTVAVIRMTASNFSSMYQDIYNRRKTEIDFINGYLIEKAGLHGISCNENERLYREIKEKEKLLNCS